MTKNAVKVTGTIGLPLSVTSRRYIKTETSCCIEGRHQGNKTAQLKQANHSTRTIMMAFLFVQYFKSNVVARNKFTSSTSMETSFRKVKSESEESEIIANVFPVNHLTFRTVQSKYMGMLMNALKKSANARLVIRMFGKV